jgi:hypothetical protein
MRFNEDLTPMLPQSISYGQALYMVLAEHLAIPSFHADRSFDRLPIALRVVTTDIITGRRVVLSSGDLCRSVRASCGVPLAFSPVAMDSMLLLDGGLTANIPIEVAQEAGAEIIVAVDVTSPLWPGKELENPFRMADQVVNISIRRQQGYQTSLADIVIRPPLEDIPNVDFASRDTLIQRGYRAARQHIAALRSALRTSPDNDQPPERQRMLLPLSLAGDTVGLTASIDSLNQSLRSQGRSYIDADSASGILKRLIGASIAPFRRVSLKYDSATARLSVSPGRVRSFRIHGNRETSARLIITASGLRKGERVDVRDFQRAIQSLYATNLFRTVSVSMDTAAVVDIRVEEKHYARTRMSLRYDEYHKAEGYIQPAYENLLGTGMTAVLHLQLGFVREKYSLELQGSQLFSWNWANNFRLQGYVSKEKINSTHIDTVDSSEILASQSLRKGGMLVTLGTQVGRVAMLEGGIRLERFQARESSPGVFDQPLDSDYDGIRYALLRLTYDALDRYPFPRNGQKHYINVGAASDAVGGTESFINIRANLGAYFTAQSRHTFAPQLRLAWANKSLPPVEVTYIGGALPDEKYREIGVYNYVSFMGLAPRAVWGDISTILQGMYRYRIGKSIFVSAIVDWGYVWKAEGFDPGTSLSRELVDRALLGAGLSVSYQTLFGPLRVGVGRLVQAGETMRKTFDLQFENKIYLCAGYDF